MDPTQWLASFRITHEHARRGSLSEDEHKKYLGMRDELARSLMNSQGQTVPEGVPPRRAFKVAQIFQIEIGGVCRTTTREISCSSFTAPVTGTFKPGERVSFSLVLTRAAEPLIGNAVVTEAAREKANSTRLTCRFENLGEERTARLEQALFDATISRF
jgi:hypothetical protein